MSRQAAISAWLSASSYIAGRVRTHSERYSTELPPVDPVRPDDADGGMRLGHGDHPLHALREHPVVGTQHLAVRAVRSDLPARDVVVSVRVDELGVVVNADARILLGVLLGDVSGAVGAAVVDDHELPVRIGLGQHT